ncbi:hypothetical protein HYU23_02835 [Candidatus Woesearchaeota archaeon]|nr:hypothetical protein [Candidatus Woesearchaeota archaeon]
MTIELTGFETWLENIVYGRTETKVPKLHRDEAPDGIVLEPQNLNCFVMLMRYCSPTRDAVLEELRKAASKVAGYVGKFVVDEKTIKTITKLEHAVINLQDIRIIDNIKNGDRDTLETLRGNVDVLEDHAGKSYLTLKYGFLHEDYLAMYLQTGGSLASVDDFDTKLSDHTMKSIGYGYQWALDILFDGRPHERKYLDSLLEAKDKKGIVRVRGRLFDLNDVRGVLDAVYSSSSLVTGFSYIIDVTDNTISDLALDALIKSKDTLIGRHKVIPFRRRN